MIRIENLIDNEFVPPQSGRYRVCLHPATLAPECEAADSALLDVVRAIQAGNRVRTKWAGLAPEARLKHLQNLLQILSAGSDRLAGIQAHECGLPLENSRQSVAQAITALIATIRQAGEVRSDDRSTGHLALSHFSLRAEHPIGLVGLITPAIDPVASMLTRLAPAILAGNVVVAKPSRHTPKSINEIATFLIQAGFPAGVVNIVHGSASEVGEAIVRHPGVQAVAFAGKSENGSVVQQRAAEQFKRTHLELGARNAVLVFAETNLEKTVHSVARLALSGTTMANLRGSRIFVQESIYPRFLELLKDQFYAAEMKTGDPEQTGMLHGPLVSEDMKTKFESAVSLALNERGRLITGGVGRPEHLGSELPGHFVKPTVIADLTLCSVLQQEEVIGPLVTVSSFKYQNDAIKQCNTSPLGRAAYIFCADGGKAMRVAGKIEAGQVFINASDLEPQAGASSEFWKLSGMGGDGVENLKQFFTRRSLITQNINP